MKATGHPAIVVENLGVTFSMGRHVFQAVRDVSFCVAPGECFGIVGESGSGKSTILRVLAGFLAATNGSATVGNHERYYDRGRSRSCSVQLIFQDPYGSLHPRHTVDQALREPLIINGRTDVEQKVKQILDEVGLGASFRYRYPNNLSGGQRQRVAIARSIILEPSVLLLDEPTSALDVSVQAEVLNLLRRMRKLHGMTFVLVTHNLGVVANMCDRFAVMRAGEIVEIATVEQLRARELVHEYSRSLLSATFDLSVDNNRFPGSV